jgi:hypothetical protein
MEKTLRKTIGQAFTYTLCVLTVICTLVALCNVPKDNEIFVAIFMFGTAIIFTIFLCTFIIVNAIKNK